MTPHGTTRRDIDALCMRIDALSWEASWADIDALLVEGAAEERLTVRVTVLTMTKCVAANLPSRVAYVARTEALAREAGRDVEALLGGLR